MVELKQVKVENFDIRTNPDYVAQAMIHHLDGTPLDMVFEAFALMMSRIGSGVMIEAGVDPQKTLGSLTALLDEDKRWETMSRIIGEVIDTANIAGVLAITALICRDTAHSVRLLVEKELARQGTSEVGH